MAVTVTDTSSETIARPSSKKGTDGTRPPNGSRGPNGLGGRGGGGGGGRGAQPDPLPERYRTGMWLGLASILMMFTALSSAYVVRAGSGNDWRPLDVPPFLWVSTALIVASSFVIERARRALTQGSTRTTRTLLFVTLLLGLGFVGSQLLAWRQLVAQGIYLKSSPHSSFFYVMTGMHGLHVLGGLFGLNYLLLSTSSLSTDAAAKARRFKAVDAVTLYWHFMDGLWIYLFLLLFLWR